MNTYRTMSELETGLSEAGHSPRDGGTVEMIVRRPDVDQREVVENATLDAVEGLIGDNWRTRGSKHTEDGSALPGAQIAIMNSRVIQVITQERSRWPVAGDQLFVDLDLSEDNLPPGQCLAIGTVIMEITDIPHTGCDKFTERFGHDAIRFVNSKEGRQRHLRGIYARVVQSGTITTGDSVKKC